MYNETIIRFGFYGQLLSAEASGFDLDYSGYHKNLIQ